jgi:hypothetical protein
MRRFLISAANNGAKRFHHPNGFVADIDTALKQQIFDLPQREHDTGWTSSPRGGSPRALKQQIFDLPQREHDTGWTSSPRGGSPRVNC